LFVTSDTSQVTLNVKDLVGNNLADVIIRILEFDIGTNTFKEIESVSTDTSGNALANLVLLSKLYVFKVQYQGVILLSDGPTKVLSTTKNFRIDISSGNNWKTAHDTVGNLDSSLKFNNATKTFTFSYTDPSISVQEGCLQVQKINFSKTITMFNTCETGNTKEITYVLSPVRKQRYVATGTVIVGGTSYIVELLDLDFGVTERFFGEDGSKVGVFASFMMITAMTMIGSFSVPAAILLNIAGFFVATLFGFKLGAQALIVLVLLGGILIYRVNKV